MILACKTHEAEERVLRPYLLLNLQVKGKIVVFNEIWVDYGTTVSYRDYGAAATAKLGGVASLIRSVTPFSIYSPHTGWQDYEKGNKLLLVCCTSNLV